jgi:hypothetical protein
MKTMATKDEIVEKYLAKREYHGVRKSIILTAEEFCLPVEAVCKATGFNYENWG